MKILVRLLVAFIKVFDAFSNRVATGLFRAQQLLTGILPALVPPSELTGLVQTHYARTYREASALYPDHSPIWTLEPWERDVIARHMREKGSVLVLGTGVGRESIELARQGYSVVGLDIQFDALRRAQERAKTTACRIAFVQASFLALPTLPGRFDYVWLPSVMYSAIPGRRERQEWVRLLRPHLNVRGRAILNFMIVREPETATHRFTHRLARRLMRLPGANASYQDWDTCAQGHFLHLFATESEIRSELQETDASVIALNWPEGYVVITWDRRAPLASENGLEGTSGICYHPAP